MRKYAYDLLCICMRFKVIVFVYFTITNVSNTALHVPKPANSECSKCGTIKKSGQLSCCAPGGAWFQNCGNGANSNLDHTWFEGIQACVGVEAKVKAMLNTQAMAFKPTDAVPKQNIDSADDTVYVNCRGYCEITNVSVVISFLFIISQMLQSF